MALEFVKKRDGRMVEFDPKRIELAIAKACLATSAAVTSDDISEITTLVIAELEGIYVQGSPSVEDVQDVVEKNLAEYGLFEVARSYILYRAEHNKIREAEAAERLDRMEAGTLKVKKRDGSLVPFDPSQIEKMIKSVCDGDLKPEEVSKIIEQAKLSVYDGISTADINQAVIMVLCGYIERDPIYSKLTSRFLANETYKQVIGVDQFDKNFSKIHQVSFAERVREGVEKGRLDKRLLDFDLDKLAAAMDTSRDDLFLYRGIRTLFDRYFLRDGDNKLLETPQYFWMRVAMGLSLLEKDKDQAAIAGYDTISRMLYVPSTPTLLHSGTSHPQMSSCYLTTVEDDLESIFHGIGNNAQLSKWSGGLGGDWTNIRATNAWIKSINTHSQGVIPFLKIVDSTTASINRSGKRRGATAVYLETWHLDIEDFLELRKNTGDDRRRTHDTNTVNWIPDLFVKRVRAGLDWTLFSPDEVPDLHRLYGKKFEERYAEYEKLADEGKIRLFKRLPAVQLWRKMITMLFETGHPWMTFKDPSNLRSPQDHVGTVNNSNLCTEITLNTSKDEVAVCNIGSINLANFITDGKLDKQKLEPVVHAAMRLLDNVIDINFYPVPEAENSNMKHRPVGLGLMGTQDALYLLGLDFDSEEAVAFSDEVMEFISYHAILASSELAKEKGAYSTYKGSKWDRGIFPIDSLELMEKERGLATGVDKKARMDWAPVREHVRQYGMRNSNTMAIAPTATISNIAGCLPSIEPIYKNLYVKSNFSGEFTVINEYLIEDLKKAGVWNKDLLDKVKYHDGSIQTISEIPAALRSKYKETFEIDPIWTIRHAAYRGKWIDQSQSVNIFTSTDSGKEISDIYMAAWEMGLKTTYYLRTLAASAIEKSTLDINKKFEGEKPAAEEPAVLQQQAALAEAVAIIEAEVKPEELKKDEPVLAAVMAAAAPAPVAASSESVPSAVGATVSMDLGPELSGKKACLINDPTCEACQ